MPRSFTTSKQWLLYCFFFFLPVFFGNGFGGTGVEVTTSEVVVTIAGVVGENVPLLVLRFEICAEVSALKRAKKKKHDSNHVNMLGAISTPALNK